MKHSLKKFWQRFRSVYRELISSKMFLRNLGFTGGIMLIFFAIFALTTYNQSRRILFDEFSASCRYQLEVSADAVDSHVTDMRFVIATLDQNSLVKAFFSRTTPEYLYPAYQVRIQELLAAYTNSYASIDSIYLYSEMSGTLITANAARPLSYVSDRNWMDSLDKVTNSGDILIFPRAKNDSFPYLLCIMKVLNINGHKAAIVLNLNLSNVSYLTRVEENPYTSIYLVSDDSEIIYSYHQRELTGSLDEFAKLHTPYETRQPMSEVIADGKSPYVYAQVHSSGNRWYYVTTTDLEAYTDLLSSNSTFLTVLFMLLLLTAIGISIAFSVHSVRPIHEMMVLLDGSVQPGQSGSGDEVGYITQKIVSYAQQNQELSAKLTQQLNLLNQSQLLALQSQINPHFLFNTLNMIYTCECEELGYQHELPGITLSLSRLLRYAFQSTDLVSLDTELEFTKIYLELMRRRYVNRFTVVYDVAAEALSASVPKLFIQPIVENAIFHGLVDCRKEHPCLRIVIRSADGYCTVRIIDNGNGMDEAALKKLSGIADEPLPTGTGIGVKNVITRMRLLYAERFSMEVSSERNVGTTFVFRFPIL